jgi:hypothetical protein
MAATIIQKNQNHCRCNLCVETRLGQKHLELSFVGDWGFLRTSGAMLDASQSPLLPPPRLLPKVLAAIMDREFWMKQKWQEKNASKKEKNGSKLATKKKWKNCIENCSNNA